MTWRFQRRSLAGIAPCAAAPGYREILFMPRAGGGVRHAGAAVGTPFGRAAISWQLGALGAFEAELVIPPGAEGCFSPPPGWCGDTVDALPGSGIHRIASHPDSA